MCALKITNPVKVYEINKMKNIRFRRNAVGARVRAEYYQLVARELQHFGTAPKYIERHRVIVFRRSNNRFRIIILGTFFTLSIPVSAYRQ